MQLSPLKPKLQPKTVFSCFRLHFFNSCPLPSNWLLLTPSRELWLERLLIPEKRAPAGTSCGPLQKKIRKSRLLPQQWGVTLETRGEGASVARQILGVHLSGVSGLENGLSLWVDDLGDGGRQRARSAPEDQEAHQARVHQRVLRLDAERPLDRLQHQQHLSYKTPQQWKTFFFKNFKTNLCGWRFQRPSDAFQCWPRSAAAAESGTWSLASMDRQAATIK